MRDFFTHFFFVWHTPLFGENRDELIFKRLCQVTKKIIPISHLELRSQLHRINRKKYSNPEFTPELKIYKRIR